MPDSQQPGFPLIPSPTVDNPGEFKTYLDGIYNFAVQNTENNIEWYSQKAGSNRSYARAARFGAISLVAVAGITPLIIGTGVLPDVSTQVLTQLSYIFLGIAALLIGLDKFFGFSSSWMRFITTKLALETILTKFRYDWAIASVGVCDKLEASACDPLLKIVQTFAIEVQSAIQNETAMWASELNSNLAEVDKTISEKSIGLHQGGAFSVLEPTGISTPDKSNKLQVINGQASQIPSQQVQS